MQQKVIDSISNNCFHLFFISFFAHLITCLGFFDGHELPNPLDASAIADACWSVVDKRVLDNVASSLSAVEGNSEKNLTISDDELPTLSRFFLDNIDTILKRDLGETANARIIQDRMYLLSTSMADTPHNLLVNFVFVFE